MKFFLLLIIIAQCTFAQLLDKVAGVINDKIFTLSEVQRIKETIDFRTEVAPLVYKESSYELKDILDILTKSFIVRDKLSEMGFVISDDSVESRIIETERSQGLKRQDLVDFLDSRGITFSEYFDLIKLGMEYNIFYSRIIAPLVNITDQEIKNAYYESKSDKEALSFIVDITDFSFNKTNFNNKELAQLPTLLDEYIKTGNISSDFKDFESNHLGKIKIDDLPKELASILANTDEGSFSPAYIKDNVTHIFYIKTKDLAESDEYLRAKDRIYNDLFIKKSKSILINWFSRESVDYYILDNL